MLRIVLVLCCCLLAVAYMPKNVLHTVARCKTMSLRENFFININTVTDPAAATPKEIFGEVAYKDFINRVEPTGLLSDNYNIVQRIREQKLLTVVANSGLLETLEQKGLTLSKLEGLLTKADELKVLQLVKENKKLLKSLAPLGIEPAPAIIPILVKLLKSL